MMELTKEQKQEIARLYNYGKGLSFKEISSKTEIPYSIVCDNINLKRKDFDSVTRYLKFRANKRGYETAYKYNKDRITKKYGQTISQRRNFHAQQLGYKSRTERQKIKNLEERLGEEIKKLSLEEKRKILEQEEIEKEEEAKRKRIKRLEKARRLRALIKTKLDEINKPRKWLADELGVHYNTLCKYINGYLFFPKELSPKLAELINIDYFEIKKFYDLRNKIEKLEKAKELGDLIIIKLDEINKPRKWLADELGVNYFTLTRYIRGQLLFPEELLPKLIELTNADYSEFEKFYVS